MGKKRHFVIFVEAEADTNADEVKQAVKQAFKNESLKLEVIEVKEGIPALSVVGTPRQGVILPGKEPSNKGKE